MTTQTSLFIGGDSDGMRLAMQNFPAEYRMDVKRDFQAQHHGYYTGVLFQSYKHYAIPDADGSTLHLYVCGGNVKQPLHQLADGYRANNMMNAMAKHLHAIVDALGASHMVNDPLLTRAILDARVFLLKNNLTAG